MGALLPRAGLPALLAGWPEAELLEADALLDEALLEDALLDEALLLEDELLDEELEEDVCSSSEKSTSSGGSPWLLVDGSGGIRLSSGRWSDSL
ncbi:hypothetical protein [Microbulbifer taiwanensis]|uniref:Secreted protein n=1 Tax=Microbulbifer taiwanensis TaxID=986746 RepID=A0ABW1YSW0_9GAMM|nr:hypothetical protein [Microbulbifer taiwanensis]